MNLGVEVSASPMLFRLPTDVAQRLKEAVPARQRNRFVVELLREHFMSPQAQLIAAAEAMNAFEAANPKFVAEGKEWLEADLNSAESEDIYEGAVFGRTFQETPDLPK